MMDKLERIKQCCIAWRNSLQYAEDNKFEAVTSAETHAQVEILETVLEEISHIESNY